MITRRVSDYFKYQVVKTATGYEARRTNPTSSSEPVGDVLFLNFRTSSSRSPTNDQFTLEER